MDGGKGTYLEHEDSIAAAPGNKKKSKRVNLGIADDDDDVIDTEEEEDDD